MFLHYYDETNNEFIYASKVKLYVQTRSPDEEYKIKYPYFEVTYDKLTGVNTNGNRERNKDYFKYTFISEYKSDITFKDTLEQMNYFLESIEKESFIPLYLNNFGEITFSDNFTPSFMFNVSAGKTNELYLETKVNETMLIYIEFSLENNSKDINFEINKYELFSDEFKNIFKEEKIETDFKIFLLCNGCSLYQIIFDNYYSWFTSKDISYKITLLKMDDKLAKEIEIQDNNINENKEEEIKEEKEEKEVKEEEVKDEKKEEKENKEDKGPQNINIDNMNEETNDHETKNSQRNQHMKYKQESALHKSLKSWESTIFC